MNGRDARDLEARTHRALSHVSRVRIMQLLRDGPRDVHQLRAATGLHANTVRSHLEVLTLAKLVARRQLPPSGPGRPPVVYELADPPPVPSRTSFATLATVLAASLAAATDDPAPFAEAAGQPLGRSLVAGQSDGSVLDAIAQVVDMLDDLGFDPELLVDHGSDQAQVLLHRCPFDDLALRYGDIVCAAHLGIIRGALDQLGASVRADLTPWVEPTVCLTEIGLGPPTDG